jgi:alkylhydroperoxidase family enzyme
MPRRHAEVMEALRDAVLEAPGELDLDTRRRLLDGDGPPGLRPYLEKVRSHAYTVVDGDVEALREAGWSEDALFEATVATAVGEGLRRLEAGLAALGAGHR